MNRSSLEILLVCVSLLWLGCASGHLREYEFFSRINDWESAEQSLRDALAADPDNPELYYLLGRVYGNWGKFSELDMAFHKSLTISDMYADDIDLQRDVFVREVSNRGIELYNGGNYLEAIETLERVEIIRSEEASHLPYLGLCYSVLEEDEKARRVLFLSMELNRDDLSTEELVFVNQRLGDQSGVIQAAERLLSRHPGRMEVLSALAAAYEKESFIPEAIETYRKILKLDPEDSSARYNLILLLSREELFQEAISMIDELRQSEPENSRLRFKACSLLYDAGRLEESLACFEQYDKNNPGERDVLEYLFVLNLNLNRQDDLRDLYPRLNRADPADTIRTEEDHETQ